MVKESDVVATHFLGSCLWKNELVQRFLSERMGVDAAGKTSVVKLLNLEKQANR